MSGSCRLFILPLLATMLLCGCFGAEARLEAPSLDPQASGNQALTEYDTDNDGAIAGSELDKVPGLKAGLEIIDANQDKRITSEEIAARVQAYIDSKTAQQSLLGRVLLNGAPLADAVVTLTPEKFMGPATSPAKGTTDASGNCSFRIDGAEFPGVNSGVYRIEVSKKDASGRELIPAKYNSATTLGEEIGIRSKVILDGTLLLDLESR